MFIASSLEDTPPFTQHLGGPSYGVAPIFLFGVPGLMERSLRARMLKSREGNQLIAIYWAGLRQARRVIARVRVDGLVTPPAF